MHALAAGAVIRCAGCHRLLRLSRYISECSFALAPGSKDICKQALSTPRSARPGQKHQDMAPHLTPDELDLVMRMVGQRRTGEEILAVIAKQRRKTHTDAPKIDAVYRAMRGRTHQRGRVETRGRKRSLSVANVRTLDAKRKALIGKAKGDYQVTWGMVQKRARIDWVHRTTVSRALQPLGVKCRVIREKPLRSEEQDQVRMNVCDTWRKKPAAFWKHSVDLIIDNKRFPIPTSRQAKRRISQKKVKHILRTKQEGLQPGFTKPSASKHKSNPGGYVSILAGICNDRVVLWEEVKGRWNSSKAAEMYAGPIKKVLQRLRPQKRSWLIMEDNDPAGYKSGKGKGAKRANKMRTLDQPPYSPDLNPLDFSLWHAIHEKVLANADGKETVSAYKARLRRTALRMPRKIVGKAVLAIRKRANAIFEAKGGHISID